MKEDKKIIRQIQTQTIDMASGEIVEVKDTKEYNVEREPDFVKLYLKDIERVLNLPAGVSSTMYELLRCMNYDNLIALTPYIRRSIAEKICTSVDVFNHNLAKLSNEGVITKIDTGTYLANPDLFGKGKWTDIRNMRLEITYDENGRAFKCNRNVPKQLEFQGFSIEGALDSRR